MRISHKLTLIIALACLSWWAAPSQRATGKAVFATITVNTTADENGTNPAACSLREAIIAANTNAAFGGCTAGAAGLDTIQFNLGAGTPSIAVAGSALPTITEPVTINGNTGGATRVELNGAAAGAFADGLLIMANGSTISALVINRFSRDGIGIRSGNGNTVQNCYMGTNAAGTAALGNSSDGVAIYTNATNNLIGGTVAGARNLISGNRLDGVSIVDATGNLVQGNYIGTDVNGTADLGNGEGVAIFNAANNTIGGTSAGARNVISGNDRDGVLLANGSNNNQVQGNYIGTDVNGTADLGNTLDGVNIGIGTANTIGGTAAGAGNIISGNDSDGVELSSGATGNLVQGNFIGTNATGTAALGNSFNGVQVRNGAATNTIGGTTAGAGNVISGNNSNGVLITGTGTTGNQVQGNFIGTNAAGTAALSPNAVGVRIEVGATSNTIGGTSAAARNIISGNGTGIFIYGTGTTGNMVQGNFIGTDVNGTADLGNGVNGVELNNGVANNVIGGTTPGAGNLISGNNANGVELNQGMLGMPVMGNLVQGNFIGTDVTGTVDLGNTFDGVSFGSGSVNNTIGGTTAGARNVISGNDRNGVFLLGAGISGNLVQGNFIGTAVNGVADLGNSGDGVHVDLGASNNTIGGTTLGAGNLIFGNGGDGVDVDGATTVGVRILGNAISNNDEEGIDLTSGATPNDTGDPDTGENNLQNYPVLSCAQSGNGATAVSGSLNSLPTTSFRLEFFANTACDAGGFGEGRTFLGFQNVTTNASGDATFTAPLTMVVAGGQVVTATATRLDAMGNPVETSEFSACRTVVAVSPTVAINDVTVTEGNLGTTNAVFTVTLSNAVGACLPITVNYATQDGTATGPGDITPTSGSITFNPPYASNTLTQTITVPVIGDFAFEPDETFFVNITAVGALVTDAQGQGTIRNDDPPLGPGAAFPEAAELSDQKAGSVLIFNYYTSDVASPAVNTRISLTNVQPAFPIGVHLFFVDGSTCSVADAFLCLTQNQTVSLLASDYDPDTSGYVVAVASDPVTGCPINFNFLIGDEFVKTSGGFQANLGAEAIAALPGGSPVCDSTSNTATLDFNGLSYNRLPRVLAADNLADNASGNSTQLVINRIGGNLATGADRLGTLFGLLYDDLEQSYSFQLTGGVCQLRGTVSGSFPRTAPRIDQIIPAGRSGWLKLYDNTGSAILGAQLVNNANVAASANAFVGGHNLHKLTLAPTTSLTIPIFAPGCRL